MIGTDAEALVALRYHLNEVLEVLETYNRWLARLSLPTMEPDKVKAARKACEEVESYYASKNVTSSI